MQQARDRSNALPVWIVMAILAAPAAATPVSLWVDDVKLALDGTETLDAGTALTLEMGTPAMRWDVTFTAANGARLEADDVTFPYRSDRGREIVQPTSSTTVEMWGENWGGFPTYSGSIPRGAMLMTGFKATGAGEVTLFDHVTAVVLGSFSVVPEAGSAGLLIAAGLLGWRRKA